MNGPIDVELGYIFALPLTLHYQKGTFRRVTQLPSPTHAQYAKVLKLHV